MKNFAGFEDQISHWWSCVIAVAAYWILGDDNQAEQLYDTIENIPDGIADDPLVVAIFAAYECRKAVVVSNNNSNIDGVTVLKSCDKVGKLLQESISVTDCLQSDTKPLVRLYVDAIICFSVRTVACLCCMGRFRSRRALWLHCINYSVLQYSYSAVPVSMTLEIFFRSL